jgi:hypothetical protein
VRAAAQQERQALDSRAAELERQVDEARREAAAQRQLASAERQRAAALEDARTAAAEVGKLGVATLSLGGGNGISWRGGTTQTGAVVHAHCSLSVAQRLGLLLSKRNRKSSCCCCPALCPLQDLEQSRRALSDADAGARRLQGDVQELRSQLAAAEAEAQASTRRVVHCCSEI